jgi:hypothetical protein
VEGTSEKSESVQVEPQPARPSSTVTVPTLSVAQIAAQAGLSGEASTPPLVRIGYRLTIALLVLIAGVFIWVMIYAAMTQPPSLGKVKEFFPSDTAKAFDSFERLRTSWLSQIKDLLQLLVVSLLVPLVATVIGYIFGRREAERSGD